MVNKHFYITLIAVIKVADCLFIDDFVLPIKQKLEESVKEGLYAPTLFHTKVPSNSSHRLYL